MRLRVRKRVKIPGLPVFLNFTQRGLTSWGVRLAGWSWNSRRPGRSRLDLPGPASLELGGDRSPDRGRRHSRLLLVAVAAVAITAAGVLLGAWTVAGIAHTLARAALAAARFH